MIFFCHLLDKDSLLLDVGANVGVYGVLAAKTTGCRVISFEPAADTFAVLSDNVRLDELGQFIEAHNVALGDEDGDLRISVGEHGPNHVVDAGGELVSQRRLDDVVGDRRPIAIKLDVEGYEMHVLRGAGNILAKPSLKVIMVEVNGLINRFGATVDDVRNMLREHGFKQYGYVPTERKLVAGKQDNEFDELSFETRMK